MNIEYGERFISTTINVINAKNLTTSVEINGLTADSSSISKPRSYAFICAEQNVRNKSKQWHLIEFGERKPGDFMIRLQNEHSTQGRLNLDFHDPQIKIHYILVNVNVSTNVNSVRKKSVFSNVLWITNWKRNLCLFFSVAMGHRFQK